MPTNKNFSKSGPPAKERDTETGNDDFGARYYSNRFGRWLSADWSAVPAPVPYANLTNPQTLNLYAMVADDPESFADLDGHCWWDACILEYAAIAAGAAVVVGLGVSAYRHFAKTSDKGYKEGREAAKASEKTYDAAMRGEPTDKLDGEADQKTKKALKTALEASMEGAQLPGTSTGGDIGLKPEDAVTAIITTVGLGGEVESAKKQAEKSTNKQDEQKKKQEEEIRNQKNKKKDKPPGQAGEDRPQDDWP